MIFKNLLEYKTRNTIQAIRGYLGDSIIDVGAGRCRMAKEIKRVSPNKKVSCVDVVDINETDIELMIYDGNELPYKDNEFNTGLLLFVLHHCNNPIKVLEETMRVCKDNVILIEHPNSYFMRKWDYFANNVFNHNINCPFNFKSIDRWKEIIKEHNWILSYYKKGVGAEFMKPIIRNHLFVIRKC